VSSFAALTTALSGLVAQRYGLDITGQNVANVNTPGYSRQRAVLVPVDPASAPSLHSARPGSGGGVEVTGIERIADALVDARARAENEAGARYGVASAVWSRIDSMLGEPADGGLTEQLSGFFNAWADLANRPDADATRVAVIQTGQAVADRLFRLGADLDVQWTQRHEDLGAVLTDVNETARAIADLNRSIRQAAGTGLAVNDLVDRRDVLVDTLVSLTGGTVRPVEGGMVEVYVGGMAAVRGTTYDTLSLDPAGAASLADVRAGGTVQLRWSGGHPGQLPGGSVAGTLAALTGTLPAAAQQFDDVAADLAAQVNAEHVLGQGREGVSGRPFFTGSTTADLRVDPAVVADPGTVAAAAVTEGLSGGSVADRLALLGELAGGPAATWRAVVTDLGAQALAATRRSDLQAVAVREADAARQGVSGVDLDEELTRMVMFQRAFEGASRVLTAVDQALDVLVNRTGLVGR
jgi:flagellar hook-associated protein 1 FlgK